MNDIDPSPTELMVRAALAEDVGPGDRTTEWTVPAGASGVARIVAKGSGILAGTALAETVFRDVDGALVVEWRYGDGEPVAPGDEVALITGAIGSMLTAERTALNLLGRLCGVATLARCFANEVEHTKARVVDTRKTTPGWREAEKAAVRAGGCDNHRSGLYDMILIKENHIRVSGGIEQALDAVRERAAEQDLEVEIEVTDAEELERALAGHPDRVLLDNMSVAELGDAVALVHSSGAPRPLLEASGGVTLATVREIAETGVDLISVGALTHSATPLDLSLLVQDVFPS